MPLPLAATNNVGAAMRLRYALSGAQNPASQGELVVPLDWPLSIPSGDMAARARDFTLDQVGQVFNVFEADPNKTKILWRGPSDLSARGWLSLNAETLKMRVSTTDAIHQPADAPYDPTDHVVVILKGKGPNQIYTFLIGLDSTGKAVAVTQRTPPNPQTVDPIVAATAVKRADGVDYELTPNRQALKLGPNWAQQGIGFNLMVNDADGPERKSFIQWQPGAASSKAETRIIFQP